MRTTTLYIDGMTCGACQNRIEKKLRATAGVTAAQVSYRDGVAAVEFDESRVTLAALIALIENLHYRAAATPFAAPSGNARKIAQTFAVILALYLIVQELGVVTLATSFPLAGAGMDYAMIFIIGLITSAHCLAMCGGINLSQCIPTDTGAASAPLAALPDNPRGAAPTKGARAGKFGAVLLPSLLYNGGRVLSYTLVGGIVGALGSVIPLSGGVKGAIQIFAGVFMVLMGVKMLGFFPALRRFSLPKFFTGGGNKNTGAARTNKSPLIVGLLNGLMPCGPLQAMQLYAMTTGSPWRGAFAMFLFSAGTVPLMFILGAVSSGLSRRFTDKMMTVGAILVAVLGLTMLSQGWNMAGYSLGITDTIARIWRGGDGAAFKPILVDGKQIVNSTLQPGAYPAITVVAGLPVKWTITAAAENINGCNNQMLIREYNVDHTFQVGDNLIEFTPTRAGRFPYGCWMGMIRSSITVLEPNGAVVALAPTIATEPAEVDISTEEIGIAELTGSGTQMLTLTLTDEKISPAVIVVQKGIPLIWRVKNESRDVGNAALLAPELATKFLTPTGETLINLTPEKSFIFSTADSFSFGWLEAVDDLNNFDREALKAKISAQETLIYPAEHFSRTVPDGAE